MKRILGIIAYAVLLSVVASSAHSLWIGLAEKARYQDVFPHAKGVLYWITLSASFAAGLNCIFIALRKRWALWLNPLIGLGSIVLLDAVGGPRSNEAVVLVACTLSTALPWYLWMRGPSAATAIR